MAPFCRKMLIFARLSHRGWDIVQSAREKAAGWTWNQLGKKEVWEFGFCLELRESLPLLIQGPPGRSGAGFVPTK